MAGIIHQIPPPSIERTLFLKLLVVFILLLLGLAFVHNHSFGPFIYLLGCFGLCEEAGCLTDIQISFVTI